MSPSGMDAAVHSLSRVLPLPTTVLLAPSISYLHEHTSYLLSGLPLFCSSLSLKGVLLSYDQTIRHRGCNMHSTPGLIAFSMSFQSMSLLNHCQGCVPCCQALPRLYVEHCAQFVSPV